MPEYTIEEAKKVLLKYWGYPAFRPGQQKVIESVLNGKDTMVLFPTGGGKSLCYQVPALVLDGVTIVISPLVALMQDQVEQLQKNGIRAAFINSTIPGHEIEQRLVNARNGMYKLLYISPERLATERWKIEQQQLNISLIAIDEAHCISEWGHNFRPGYRKIKEEFGDLPDHVRWMALTATATPEVRQDLLDVLKFEDPEIVTGSFSRPNLKWWVYKTEKKNETLIRAVTKGVKKGSGIVYANTRKDCEKWADKFQKAGIKAAPYHAGMSSEDREKVQKKWIKGSIPLVVATNAFGMGIDKADCRFVIHYNLPLSLEAYYQEAGRAGRDGEESFPILIYKDGDLQNLKARINRSYPEYETLIKVYNGLCDEMNLAIGSEHDKPEPVDFSKLSKRTGIRETVIESSLNILQRLDIVILTDLYEAQTGIQVVVGRDYLEKFIESAKPEKANFLDTLIRQYGPSAHHEMQYLNQKYICEKLNVTPHQLKKALRVFSDHDKLLKAEHLGDQPLIQLTNARSSKPQIDKHEAYGYRDILIKKLEMMHQYAESKGCREKFLRVYFGENPKEDCGHCDYCITNYTPETITREEIETVKNRIRDGQSSPDQLRVNLNWSKEKVLKALQFLERENQVLRVEEEGVHYKLSAS